MYIPQPGQILLAQRMVNTNFSLQNASLIKLATGLRINYGKDDPAGLISSENLRATIATLEAETRVLERADHVSSVADAALGEISGMLVEAEALAVASANTAGMSEAEIEANQMQLDSIMQSVDRIASTTSFNGDKLLDGTATIRAGDESISIDNAATGEIGIIDSGGETYDLADTTSGGPISLVDGDIGAAAESIRTAASQIASMRGEIGAFSKNIVGPAISSNAVAIENTTAAESIIRDTDFAFEISNLVRTQLLTDSSIFALTNSFAERTSVLSIFR